MKIQQTKKIEFHPTRAREIMGKNFFGIEEAVKYFGINPNKAQQFKSIATIPSLAILDQVKDTHILIAVFPLSILEIRKRNSKLFYEQWWYQGELFAKNSPSKPSWQLVRKTPVDNSVAKNWQEQKMLLLNDELLNDEEVPSAQVMVYTIIGHFLNTGERLFEKGLVRTASVDFYGSRVNLGYFNSEGLFIGTIWDHVCDDCLAVAAAWRF